MMQVSTFFTKLSVAVSLVLGLCVASHAASISIALAPGSPTGVGPFTWTYNATLPIGFQLQPSPAACTPSAPAGAICDGLITIYDFAGYISGSEFAPNNDWMFVGQLSGPTPVGVTPGSNIASVDDPLLFNLAWIYTGGAGGGILNASAADIALGGFGASSIYSGARPSEYATRSNSLAFPNARAISSDTTLVPAIPEPATVLLFGTGLLALAAFQRRRKS